jgi:hypothetical protein
MDYLTEIFATVIIGLIIYFIEKHLGKIYKKYEQSEVKELVRIAVDAIEQKAKLKDMSKEEKFAYVFTFVEKKLKEKGIDVDLDEIELLIEHFVFQINKNKEG